jgi:large subunit ribosomal protein L18
MKLQKRINLGRRRRTFRVRKPLRAHSTRPRLCVFRSNKHIYCQLVDDQTSTTLASASTRDKQLRATIANGGNCAAARLVGVAIAERAKAAGITEVKFDRGVNKYHGRLAELAKAARENGLVF